MVANGKRVNSATGRRSRYQWLCRAPSVGGERNTRVDRRVPRVGNMDVCTAFTPAYAGHHADRVEAQLAQIIVVMRHRSGQSSWAQTRPDLALLIHSCRHHQRLIRSSLGRGLFKPAQARRCPLPELRPAVRYRAVGTRAITPAQIADPLSALGLIGNQTH